jgi:membrane fusion protein (multidrug efflux system)
MQENTSHLKIIILLIGLVLSLLPAGCDRRQQAEPPLPPVRVVSTIMVTPQRIVLETQLPGRTTIYKVAQIRPQVNGLIQKRLFKEGSDVKAGQILYQIDPAPFQAALDSAVANLVAAQKAAERARAALAMGKAYVTRHQAILELARMNAQRYKDLARANAVSVIQRDQAVTQDKVAQASLLAARAQVASDGAALAAALAVIRQAESAVQTSRINLGYCRVLAPISGRIGKSSVTQGAIVTAYQPVSMATIQQLDPIYVDVPQSTTQLLRLKRRLADGRLNLDENNPDNVRLLLEDNMAYPLEGTLQFTDVTVDPSTGSVILRLVFPNPKGMLLPGMFVRTLIKEGVNDQAILVPQQGVSRDHKGNPMALIVDAQNHVEMRMLTLDKAMGNKWLVSAGLAPGDRVIVEGMQMLRPGMFVKAVPFKGLDARQNSEANKDDVPGMKKDGGA